MIDGSRRGPQVSVRPPSAGSRRSWRTLVVGLAVLSLLVTLPPSLEDFVYGIPERFGLGVLSAGILLAAGYALHVVGILLAARGSARGYGINFLVRLGWLVGAVADHLSEVLYAAPYRAGLPSKLLEVGTMVIGAALAVVSALALSMTGARRHRA